MDALEIRNLFRERLGIRLEPEMCRFVLRQVEQGQASAKPPGAIPVMGGDSRTGVAVRTMASLDLLTAVQP